MASQSKHRAEAQSKRQPLPDFEPAEDEEPPWWSLRYCPLDPQQAEGDFE